MLMITALIIATVLTFILAAISYLLAEESDADREKSSPFECGFEPNKNARLPFSLRFFLIAIIFLIFDVEITLLLPLPIILTNISINYIMFSTAIIMLILLAGLYYEWKKGALNWT